MKIQSGETYAYLQSNGNPETDHEQLLAIQLKATELGLRVKEVVLELSKTNTEKLEALYRLVETGKVSAIGIYSLSSLPFVTASLESFFSFLGFLSINNVRIFSVKEALDSSLSVSSFAKSFLDSYLELRDEIRRENIHRGLKKAKSGGTAIGRPKKADDLKIRELRDEGYSLQEIANQLGISVGSVQYSLRQNSNPAKPLISNP